MQEVSRLLKGFFSLLKSFLDSPAKKFVLLVHKTGETGGRSAPVRRFAGMFLSAAQEFGSVQFRTVRLDDKDELRDAIRGSLDRSQKVIETIYRDGTPVSRKGVSVHSIFQESNGWSWVRKTLWFSPEVATA